MNSRDAIEKFYKPGELKIESETEIYDPSYTIIIPDNMLFGRVYIEEEELSISDMLCMIQGLQRAIEILREREEKYNANNS